MCACSLCQCLLLCYLVLCPMSQYCVLSTSTRLILIALFPSYSIPYFIHPIKGNEKSLFIRSLYNLLTPPRIAKNAQPVPYTRNHEYHFPSDWLHFPSNKTAHHKTLHNYQNIDRSSTPRATDPQKPVKATASDQSQATGKLQPNAIKTLQKTKFETKATKRTFRNTRYTQDQIIVSKALT